MQARVTSLQSLATSEHSVCLRNEIILFSAFFTSAVAQRAFRRQHEVGKMEVALLAAAPGKSSIQVCLIANIS